MGLDMFIIRKKKGKKKISDNWYENGDELAYWRKANQIHKWFVDNVQNGIDDGGKYRLSKEQIQKLLDTCKYLADKIILIDDEINNGQRLVNGKWEDIKVKGKKIVNKDLCRKILPTTDGFFFGSTDYDEYYYEDIMNTIKQLTKILSDDRLDEYDLVYMSSW